MLCILHKWLYLRDCTTFATLQRQTIKFPTSQFHHTPHSRTCDVSTPDTSRHIRTKNRFAIEWIGLMFAAWYCMVSHHHVGFIHLIHSPQHFTSPYSQVKLLWVIETFRYDFKTTVNGRAKNTVGFSFPYVRIKWQLRGRNWEDLSDKRGQ